MRMLHRVLAALVVAAGLILPAASALAPALAQGGKRVALVIGNGAYQNAEPLANPPNDARAMHDVLRRMGFDSELVLDADRAAMERAVRRLGERARGADAAVLFYAGHAIEVAGKNMLIPTSAAIQTERDVPFEALDFDAVVAQLDGQARNTVVFLDACRNNPFRELLRSGSRSIGRAGLAAVQAPTGMLVSFAADRGQVALDGSGRNSPFTTALLRHIETADTDVRLMLDEVRQEVMRSTGGRQRPREDVALLPGGFYFHQTAAGAAATAAARPAAPAPAPVARPSEAARDQLLWEQIKDSRNAADYRAYLEAFPDGIFAALARSRAAQFEVASRGVIRPDQLAAGRRSPAAPDPAAPTEVAAVPAAPAVALPLPAPAPAPAPAPVATPRSQPAPPVAAPAAREQAPPRSRRPRREAEEQVALARPAVPPPPRPSGPGPLLDIARRLIPLPPGEWREVSRVTTPTTQIGWNGDIPVHDILLVQESGGRIRALASITVSDNIQFPMARWPIPPACTRRDAPFAEATEVLDRSQDCRLIALADPRAAVEIPRRLVNQWAGRLPEAMITSQHRLVIYQDQLTVTYYFAPELFGAGADPSRDERDRMVARLRPWSDRVHGQLKRGFSRDITQGAVAP